MDDWKKMRKKNIFKIILCLAALLAAAAVLWIYAVYHGYLLLNYPSKARFPVRGVDVSHYQGSIDWEVLSQADIQFAYIKATEGSSHRDDRFLENWEAVKEIELKAGAYHFFSFDSPGESQAQNFIDAVNAGFEGAGPVSEDHEGAELEGADFYRESWESSGMLPPVVDVEYYADKRQNPPAVEDVQRELQVMLDELEQYYGMKPVVYSTEEVWEKYLNGCFDAYPLWIRNVFHRPAVPDEKWTFWQYSNRGRLKGYSGAEEYIDLNVFNGSEAEWEEFCHPV